MSSAPVAPAAPAQKPTAIQLLEQELFSFYKQHAEAKKLADEAISRVHAIDGAIQATQHLLGKLRAAAEQAAAEAAAEAKKLVAGAESEVEHIAAATIEEAVKIKTEVVADAKSLESKVVEISKL